MAFNQKQLFSSFLLPAHSLYTCSFAHWHGARKNPRARLAQMTAHVSTSATNGYTNGVLQEGVSLADLPKSNVFTSSLPADPKYPTPSDSHKAKREELGPRMVKGALFTYVRPEETKESELLGVSKRAMKDIGLREGEEKTKEFRDLVAGNKIMWDPETESGIYPWAQCYGGACVILN